MSGRIIQWTTILLSVLSETAFVFNFWPCSPQKHFSKWSPRYAVRSEATTVLFGLLMPPLANVMLLVPIPPKFLLICTGIFHMLVTQVASMVFRSSRQIDPAVRQRDENGRSEYDSSGETMSKGWHTSSGLEVVQLFSLKRWQVLLVYMMPTTTAALYEVMFQLFTSSLQASDTTNTPHRGMDDFIEWVALLQYIVAAPGCSFLLSYQTSRVHPLSTSGLNALWCLPTLWIMRVGGRLLLNQSLFPPLTFMRNTALADNVFSPAQYEWFRDLVFEHPILFLTLPAILWPQIFYHIERHWGSRLANSRLEKIERTTDDEARMGRVPVPIASMIEPSKPCKVLPKQRPSQSTWKAGDT